MSNSLKSNGIPNGGPNKQKRFSIDDAFEEETDEAIKVYGSTTGAATVNGAGDCNGVKFENGRFVFQNGYFFIK